MDIKIKIEAVVAGLLAVRDKYIFTVMGHTIAVSPIETMTDTHFILFDKNGFYRSTLTKEEYDKLCQDFGDAVD